MGSARALTRAGRLVMRDEIRVGNVCTLVPGRSHNIVVSTAQRQSRIRTPQDPFLAKRLRPENSLAPHVTCKRILTVRMARSKSQGLVSLAMMRCSPAGAITRGGPPLAAPNLTEASTGRSAPSSIRCVPSGSSKCQEKPVAGPVAMGSSIGCPAAPAATKSSKGSIGSGGDGPVWLMAD